MPVETSFEMIVIYVHVALDHRDGISSSYIGFSSFIIVGLIIMTAAVIVTTIRSNAKGMILQITHLTVCIQFQIYIYLFMTSLNIMNGLMLTKHTQTVLTYLVITSIIRPRWS